MPCRLFFLNISFRLLLSVKSVAWALKTGIHFIYFIKSPLKMYHILFCFGVYVVLFCSNYM